MPEYNYNLNGNEQMKNPVMTGTVQNSILKAYGWMFAGLLLSAATAFVFSRFGLFEAMAMNMPMLLMLLPIVQIGLAIGFTASMRRASVTTLKVLFILYAGLMGISLSSLAFIYDYGTLFLAFFISALYFGTLVFIGITTKKDLSKLGTIALAALVVMLVSQLIMMIFRISGNVRLFSAIGLLIFAGLTAWDVQRLNKTMLYSQGEPVAMNKWAIYFALELYLDFINIFLYVLRLLGMGSRRN